MSSASKPGRTSVFFTGPRLADAVRFGYMDATNTTYLADTSQNDYDSHDTFYLLSAIIGNQLMECSSTFRGRRPHGVPDAIVF